MKTVVLKYIKLIFIWDYRDLNSGYLVCHQDRDAFSATVNCQTRSVSALEFIQKDSHFVLLVPN
jgi:hypothetical protein